MHTWTPSCRVFRAVVGINWSCSSPSARLTFLKALANPRLARSGKAAPPNMTRNLRELPASRPLTVNDSLPSTAHVAPNSRPLDAPTQPPCPSARAPASSPPSAQTTASSTPAAMRQQHPALSPPASQSSGTRPSAPRRSTSGTRPIHMYNGRLRLHLQTGNWQLAIGNALSPDTDRSRTTTTTTTTTDKHDITNCSPGRPS